MFQTLRKLLEVLTSRERYQLIGVLAAVVSMGLLQMAAVGSIMPFVSLLANRDLIQEQTGLAWVYTTLGFSSTNSFLIFVGSIVLFLLVAGNAFTAFTIWLMARFSWATQHRLSSRLLDSYLAQPYASFLVRNSADTGKNILTECQQFTSGVMTPLLRTTAFGVTAFFITGFLLWLSPLLTLLAAATFGIGYVLIYLLVRRTLLNNGRRRVRSNTDRFKAVNEAFGGIKEVKVLGREADFSRQYHPAAREFADAMALQQILSALPRYAIEALGFGLIIAAFLYLLSNQSSLQAVLPLASTFALAAYRLLPALQQIYQGISALRFNQASLDTLYEDLRSIKAATVTALPDTHDRLPFARELKLQDVSFTYPGAGEPALQNINLTIAHRTFVAFVGSTGAGKTTLVDLVLGLLRPQSGRIEVDGVELDEQNLRAWRANIGYVPQDIYLMDDSIEANIAFGIPGEDIDREAVERAARTANIHDFISGRLDQGYRTLVGERGVRLSGGQRQRIGIARALYHNPEVLVLDEATSALDGSTEAAVHQAIIQAAAAKTVIMIAHRLATVRRCDWLYLMEHGRIIEAGSYDDLLETSTQFRHMAGGMQ